MTQNETSGTLEVTDVADELRVVIGRLARRLREQSDTADLTRSQTSVLGRIEREGSTTATALARAEGMRPQSMGPIVAALEEAGLIERRSDPADGRKTRLDLTPAAREHYRTGRIARSDWLSRKMSDALSPAEIEQIHSTAALLRRLAE